MTKQNLDISIKEDIKDLVVKPDNQLRQMFVDYVGEKKNPEDGKVTLDMVISVLSDEFPEFVLAMAEKNFLLGYKQAFSDMEKWNKKTVSKATPETKSVDVFETPNE
jgi:hypothetical protein